MTQSAFQLLQKMDRQDIQLQLAAQCAPLILGLKISNLLILPQKHVFSAEELLSGTGIASELLLCDRGKATLLLYRRNPLQEYLNQKHIADFLLRMGYSSSGLRRILPIFCGRYQAYMRRLQAFPHEMGILLGYPLEDVEGFIRHSGKNFLYTGYWKVYKNLPEKMKLFHRYERATEYVLRRIARGEQMADIIRAIPGCR